MAGIAVVEPIAPLALPIMLSLAGSKPSESSSFPVRERLLLAEADARPPSSCEAGSGRLLALDN